MRNMALAVLFGMASSVSMAAQLKAGLWEVSTMSDALKALPKLSEEQIAQIKKLGMNVPQIQDGGVTTKVCISKEMAERNEIPQMKNSGCEPQNVQTNGDRYAADVVCNGSGMKGTGKLKGLYSGETFTSTYDFKGTAYGQPVNQHMESKGKWLNADCGSIKPVQMPEKN